MQNTSRDTTLYVVRHGESLDNAGVPHVRTAWGSSLTARGVAQAETVARELAGVDASAVIASNLTRARETAEIIARDRHLTVEIVAELHEREVGSFAGRERLEDTEEYRDKFQEYERGSQEEKMAWKLAEDWESLEEAGVRFVDALHGIVEAHRGQTLIVVAHGTVMRAFLIYAGYGTLEELREGAVDNTGYVKVKTDGEFWRVVSVRRVHLSRVRVESSPHEE